MEKQTFDVVWEEVDCNGSLPPERAYHNAVIKDDKIIVYGGSTKSKTCTNNLYIFDTVSFTWSALVTEAAPSRSHHASVVHNSNFITVGGWDGHKRCNNIFCLDLESNKWTEMDPKGKEKLPGHSSHTLTVFENKLITVGRQSGQRRWSDTHSLDLNTKQWKLENSKVKSRSGHSATLHNDKIFIWGGRKSSDIDIINTNTLTSSSFSFVNGPLGSAHHGACLIPNTSQLLTYGGIIASVTSLKDIQLLDLGNYNDYVTYSQDSLRWSTPRITGNPPSCYGHSMSIIGNKIYVFGGYRNGKLSNKMSIITINS